MLILAIDPGTTASHAVWFAREKNKVWEVLRDIPNTNMVDLVSTMDYNLLVIEDMEHFGEGMPVGKSVFETVRWTGRFDSACTRRGRPYHYMKRSQVKLILCNSRRAKDKNVRQAIIDRFGGDGVAIGLKDSKGPLYSVKSHAWQALALALAWVEENER